MVKELAKKYEARNKERCKAKWGMFTLCMNLEGVGSSSFHQVVCVGSMPAASQRFEARRRK